MRRVFPLRPSENCLLVTYDAEELDGKESKPNSMRSGSDAFTTVDSTTRWKPQNEGNCDGFQSGDENFPATVMRKGAIGTPSSVFVTGACAYPVFNGGVASNHPVSRAALSLDKIQELKRPSSDRERITGSSSFRAYGSHEGFIKGTSSSGNLRTSSMRLLRVPDSVADSRSTVGKVERNFDTVSVGRSFHSRALSQAASEQSDAKLSDNSSCFTRSTDSNSSRSLASDSTYSKKSSTAGKPGNSGSPFRHLTARMVAEKLVKVLGKEKLCLPSYRSSAPRAGRSIKQDADGAMKRDRGMSCEATISETLAELPFSTETPCSTREPSGFIHCPEQQWVARKKNDLLSTSTIHDTAKDSCRLAIAGLSVGDPDFSILQSLEARALARENLAAILDGESNPWDDEFTPSTRPPSLTDSSAEIARQNLDASRFEASRLRMEKRDLALEVAAEIRARMSERKAANDALRHMKIEMDCQVSAIEKDRISVRAALERELERREQDWGFKLDKIRTEERRLRARVAEIAEHRNELQKEIASFKLKEASWKSQAQESQVSWQSVKQRAETSATEVVEMKKSFNDVCSKLKSVDGELTLVAQRNKFIEIENRELQKEVVRLRRVCNDQEITIEGLLQEMDEAVNSTSQCGSESLLRLQRELLRLAGVEQSLRNEIDAMHSEISGLKQEKAMVQGGASTSLMNLNQELLGEINKLHAHVGALQNENKHFSLNLQTVLRKKRHAETALGLIPDSVEGTDCTSERVTSLVECKDGMMSSGSSNVVEGNEGMPEKVMKEEAGPLWKSLSWKLGIEDEKHQNLDKDIADLLLSRDSLQIEIDDLHGKVVLANQRVRELERQLAKKDEEMEMLQGDLQDQMKELDELRSQLPCTRRQRDEMQKEAETMSREALRVTLELTELRKVVEKLDEELMVKDGQISILRGAYGSSDI